MDATLAALADFTARTRFDDLPNEVVDKASDILVDTLGCLIGGRDFRAVDAARGLVTDEARAAEWGSVVGMPGCYPAELAAFLNTAMIRYLDFNDHLVAGHASDMIGAQLAVARRPGRPASGSELLTALVVAYEVHARVVRTMNHNQTIDRTYSITIGATAGVCNLLGTSKEATRDALAMAVTAGVALRASRAGALSDFKGAASAVSVKFAVFFALLAERGLTGPSAPFEGRHGLRELIEGEAGPVVLQPFDGWQVLQTCQKYWPVAYGIQPAIWAALGLRHTVAADAVERVVLHAAPFAWHESGSERERWDPRTRESADHSMPYAFARAFEYGTVDGNTFLPKAFRNPGTLALMERITVEPDWARGPKISDVVGVRAELTTKSGQRLTVNVDEPRGHHLNPMTTAEISGKATRLVEPTLGARTEAALEIVRQVRSAPTLDSLFTAFLPT
ncbi:MULTISPECIES: MmgE/PrpD family protein [unclassified Mycobacterium]|uniref:MmgE/PrpD family protein n=1 Tax=unclassified Mycobacterium TaxID=2642494 RepID=UPI0029C98177|nr:MULTISPECIES: MmgE/PrpD family protein [unclassified Mycobacterium]